MGLLTNTEDDLQWTYLHTRRMTCGGRTYKHGGCPAVDILTNTEDALRWPGGPTCKHGGCPAVGLLTNTEDALRWAYLQTWRMPCSGPTYTHVG